MRHVILGSDTPLGSSILRVLVLIADQEIICCNPDGTIPTDVPTTNIITFNVDIRKKNMLAAVIKKDDIIYNAQLIDNEDLLDKNVVDLHVQGLINLLKIGNEKEVKKIISYIPQKITWDVPLNADEETILFASTDYQKSLLSTLAVAENYMEGKNYDLLQVTDESLKESNEPNLPTAPPEEIEVDDEDDSDSGGSEIENSTLSHNEEINDENEAAPIAPPTLGIEESTGINPPSLGGPKLESDLSQKVETDSEVKPEANPENEDENEEDLLYEDEESNEIETTHDSNEEILDLDTSVPLVIARIARFYGPFDEGITKSYCKAIRLQRIKVIGKLKNQISWINPLDAGRAMIIMGDAKVTQNQYNIIGFNATVMELLIELGNVNHSKTKIRKRFYFIQSLIIKIKSLMGKVGILKQINYEEVFGRNKIQVYSDEKARNSWGWKPKYNLNTTSKDSLNWFVNHVL